MIGALLALFKRSLREDCRAKMNYVARAGLLCVILLFLISTHQNVRLGAPGLEFWTVIYINCVFIIVGGLGHFASAITEEKEEMTLGLLRMTNLNPISILLGKSAGRVLNAVLLLVQFPFTLLAVSMGGVSIHQVIAAYCTLVAFVVMLGGVSVFFSVICRRTTVAVSCTGLFFALFLWGPFFAGMWMDDFAEMGWIAHTHPLFDSIAGKITEASPFHRLGIILQTGFADPHAGWQVWSNIATGFLFFLLAWLVFDRFCREDTEAAPGRGLAFRKTRLLRGLNAGRPWRSALSWKDFHFMAWGKTGMLIKFVLETMLVAYMYAHTITGTTRPYNSYNYEWAQLGASITSSMTLILALELSVGAARIFRMEIAWQTLSSIALLPVSISTLIYQKAKGYLLAAVPTIFYLGVGLLLVLSGPFHMSAEEGFNTFMGIVLMISEALLLVHLIAYLSLIVKRAALPLGIIIVFVGNMVSVMVLGFMMVGAGPGSVGAILFLMSAGVVTITAVFHVKIGPRLRRGCR